MNTNGNDAPDTKPPPVDLEDPAFSTMETPYQLSALRHAIILNANAQNNLASSFASFRRDMKERIRAWEETFQLRAQIMVRSAAEETAARLAEQLLPELTSFRSRLTALEGEVDDVGARASNADLKAEAAREKATEARVAAEVSGQWAASAAKTPLVVRAPESDTPPELKPYKKWIAIVVAATAGIGAAAKILSDALK